MPGFRSERETSTGNLVLGGNRHKVIIWELSPNAPWLPETGIERVIDLLVGASNGRNRDAGQMRGRAGALPCSCAVSWKPQRGQYCGRSHYHSEEAIPFSWKASQSKQDLAGAWVFSKPFFISLLPQKAL